MSQGAVAAPHPCATRAGLAVLEAGGTAAEAVVAAGAVLTVVSPHFCGRGGDAVWPVADARCFLALGQGIEPVLPAGPLPVRGPGAVSTTAALVDGWRHALAHSAAHRGGQAGPGDPLAPAIAVAEEGLAVTATRAFWAEVRSGDTVDLAAGDAAGNAASVLRSAYFDGGSGGVAGDTGILWQNRGAAFSPVPGHPNAFAPDTLPVSILNPGIARKDRRPQRLAMLLSRPIHVGRRPAEAPSGPRVLFGRTFSDGRDSLTIEGDAGAETFAALAALGHEVAPIAAKSPLAALAGVIAITPGDTEAARDPRGEGPGLVTMRMTGEEGAHG